MHKWVVSLVAAFGALLAGAGPVAAAVTVSPAPETRAASYKTQLSFRGAAPAELGTIRVTGSRTGVHRGRLQAHSDRRGASLVFSEPFRRGERVSVQTSLDIPGAKNGDYGFKVVGLGNASLIVLGAAPPSRTGAGNRRRFRSRPDLSPPAVTVLKRKAGRAPGVLMLNGRNFSGRGQQGPMLLGDDGQLIWWKAVGGRKKATDVRVQRFRGEPVLTWWEGLARQGGGSGSNVIYDTAYRQVARVQAGNGYKTDLHEFVITPQNTALVTIYNPYGMDLSALGGARNGIVVDSIVQEIDIATGLVLFEWHSIGNVALKESYSRPSPKANLRYDYFHLNSIAADTDGNLLLSARDTWGVYKIDRLTGRMIWRMGGKKSSFKMAKGTRFAYQHDAERRADGTISVFDNSASPPVAKQSRALILDVDEAAKRVTLRKSFTHPRGLLAANQGSMDTLPNGNILVGWGSQRHFTEHSPTGELLLDAQITLANDSYRAYRSPWPGLPRTGPSLAADARSARRTAVYASYNGAVGVDRWEVLAGKSPSKLEQVGGGRRRGFETRLDLEVAGPFFAVRALAADGRVLGTSRAERRR